MLEVGIRVKISHHKDVFMICIMMTKQSQQNSSVTSAQEWESTRTGKYIDFIINSATSWLLS